MKTCPICLAATFDDATTCYGCLHRFKKGEGFQGAQSITASPQENKREICAGGSSRIESQGASASFLISILPFATEEGSISWHCDVKPHYCSEAMAGQV